MTADRPYRRSDFDYELPLDLIAQRPPERRGESRLLVVRRSEETERPEESDGSERSGEPCLHAGLSDVSDFSDPSDFSDRMFSDLRHLIPPGDLLVLNTSRVRHARLLGRRASGAPAEVLLLRRATGDTWIAMGQPGSALRPGKRVELGAGAFVETLEVLPDGTRVVRFVGLSGDEAVKRFGRLPLPPYITREADATDDERYQTVYASREGSVAAPTAGLHLTDELLEALRAQGVGIAELDLEIGPGTFKPLETEELAEHRMHPEQYEIAEPLTAAVADTRRRGASIWALGTTVVRALESAATADGRVRSVRGETTLFITPGFRFRVVDHLITNFHLPGSTLLVLVCAFGGYRRVMSAYQHAIRHHYRFYSYGDAMAIV